MCPSPEPGVLVDLAQNKISVIDETGRFRYLNAAARDLLGVDPDALVGTNAFDRVHPDDAARVRAAFDAVVAAGETPESPLEYRYATADGDWLWLRTRVFPPAETGLDGYALSSRDVTLEVESRRRLETIASASPDVLWMFDADWSELLFVNQAAEPVFGVTPERLKRRPRAFLEAIHPDDRQRVERAMERLSAGEPAKTDYRIGSPDEPTTWVRVPARPVTENGEVVAITGFARDVTDEYRRERQLTVMDNLLRHTLRNDMNIVDGTAERIAQRVDDAVSAQATAADAAPGDAMLGDAAPADPAPGDVGSAELAADLIGHVQTIRRVADDLLATAEKQRGVIDLLRQREPPQPLCVAPLVEQAVADVVDDEDDPTVGVSFACPDDVRAFTHPELDYAIAELVENAVEHADASPTVEIEITAPGDRVEIAVRDNAPPIPPTERNAITDRWEMDDLRHTAGMGLWLVYWIADRSGGDLRFDAGPEGNEVTISVPDADCDPTFGAATAEEPPAAAEHRSVATRPADRETATADSETVVGRDATVDRSPGSTDP